MQCKRQTLQHYLERGNNPDRNSQSLVNIGLSDLLSNADGMAMAMATSSIWSTLTM